MFIKAPRHVHKDRDERPNRRESGPKGSRTEVDALEDDGFDDWRVDDENWLGGTKRGVEVFLRA